MKYITETYSAIDGGEGKLQEYLNSNPHPGYHFYQVLSVTQGQFGINHFLIIWEKD